MCGISGLVNWGDRDVLSRMNDTQVHRGPDDQGVVEFKLSNGGWVGLGSRRLAILDLSPAGHMPMSTPNGNLTIVYNGEVYNYLHLRQKLESKGYQFRSNSDTEVVLYLYQEYGVDCVRYLNGMFALAIWDEKAQSLFLARDHFGIKPLYYCHRGERLAFASEAKSLLQVPDISTEINFTALHQYLTFLWVPDPLTMFEGIYKLMPGHYAVFRNGSLNINQYWDLHFPSADNEFKGNETDLAVELRDRFIASVRSQMVSDVPLGAFLSAGLDSSSIVAAMATSSSQPIRTFTIAFSEKYRKGEVTFDDTEVARRTAQHFGCDHTEILVEPKIVDILPELIWHMDEPIADPAIITAYLVNRKARQDVTVLLSGVGGDELFAGYRKYKAHYLAESYRRIPNFLRQQAIDRIVEALPVLRGTPLKGYVRLAKKMVRSGSLPPTDRFLMDSVYLTEDQKRQLYTSCVSEKVHDIDPRSRHLKYFNQVAEADFLNQMLYLDTKAFMVSLNLTYNDKMSMASSVETRVPFLDWELAEWVALNVPPHLKLAGGGNTKHILRQAMQPLLPPEVLRQPKAGFGAPLDYWLAYDLRDMVDDLLSESQINKRGLFNAAAIRQLIDEQRSGWKDWSMQIYQFLTLELWQQKFMD